MRVSSDIKRVTALAGIGVLLSGVLSACGGAEAESNPGDKSLKITVVSGPLADPFFSAMKKGTEQAAKDLGVEVEWTAPKDFSNLAPDFARLGDAALAGKPDGVALSYFLPDAQLPSLQKMVDQGVPVTFLNSGPFEFEQLGVLNNVGEDPTLVGAQVGERLIDAGKKRVLCVNHAAGVKIVQLRCDTLKTVMEKNGRVMKELDIPVSQSTNPTAVGNAIAGALRTDPAIDAVFTLGSGVAENASRVIDKLGSSAMLVTTDLSTNVLNLIKEGKIAFASDQQPWLSGY